MTYVEIFNKTKEIIMKSDVSNMGGHLAVQVNIEGEGEGAFYIELKDRQVFCEPYEYYDRDCKFIMGAEDFLKLIEGELDPVFAYTVGKLRIEGSIEKALEFKNIVDTIKKEEKPAKKKTSKKKA